MYAANPTVDRAGSQTRAGGLIPYDDEKWKSKNTQ